MAELNAAGLTRETTMIFAAAFALDALFKRHWSRAALLLAAAMPLILWLILLRVWLGTTELFASSVVSKRPHLPLAGVIGISGWSPRFILTLGFIVLPGLLALGWAAYELISGQ